MTDFVYVHIYVYEEFSVTFYCVLMYAIFSYTKTIFLPSNK